MAIWNLSISSYDGWWRKQGVASHYYGDLYCYARKIDVEVLGVMDADWAAALNKTEDDDYYEAGEDTARFVSEAELTRAATRQFFKLAEPGDKLLLDGYVLAAQF